MIARLVTCKIFTFIVAMLIISCAFQVRFVSASYIWHDDFEDQNLDDWLVTRGVFSAENKTLWAYGTESATSNRAYHECNISVGCWQFDILLRYYWLWRYHPPAVRFMVSSTDDIVWQGYVLDFYTLHRPTGPILAVYLRVRADTWNYLSHFDFDITPNGWQNVSIQRSSVGRITVFLNSSLIIDVVDNSLENASYFVFDSEDCVQTVFDPATHTDAFVQVRESPMLDNIMVTEYQEVSDNRSTQMLITISAIIGVIALLIIGKEEMKKYKS